MSEPLDPITAETVNVWHRREVAALASLLRFLGAPFRFVAWLSSPLVGRVRRYLVRKRAEWANDSDHLKEVVRLTRVKDKSAEHFAAMAAHQMALSGRLMSPPRLVAWLWLVPVVLMAGWVGVAEWRTAQAEGRARSLETQRDDALERAVTAEGNFAGLQQTHNFTVARQLEESARSAELELELKGMRSRLATRTRSRDDATQRAQNGDAGALDYGELLRGLAEPAAAMPEVRGSAPAGDPAGGVSDRPGSDADVHAGPAS